MRIDEKISAGLVSSVGAPNSDELTAEQWLAMTQKTVVGSSYRIKRCLQQAVDAAASPGNVVVQGETGTGKNLFARVIHAQSSSPRSRFVVADCRALKDEAIATVLADGGSIFREGANSLALQQKRILFLDEVGELSPHSQKWVYALLAKRRQQLKVIAASQQNLERQVKFGRFRSDLLSLLQDYHIDLPTLRDRAGDIVELAEFFLARFCLWHGLAAKSSTPEYNAMLLQYHWPGNVRELANTLEQSLLATGLAKTLFPKHLPGHIRISVTRSSLFQQCRLS